MQVAYRVNDTEHGRELLAAEDITRGSVIWCYDTPGLRLSLAEIVALPPTERATFETYCWQIDIDKWEGVTERPEDDPVDFINHSCQPNMSFSDDETLVAWCDIKNGEALTLEYATCDTIYARIDQCRCGSSQCRGQVTATDALDPAILGSLGVRSCIARLRPAHNVLVIGHPIT